MKGRHYLGFVLAAVSLGACNGVTEPDLPSERPFSSVSGYVVDDPIHGATMSVYAFDGGRQGELLATSAGSGADGAYTLQLQSKDRPVLIEARGGAFDDLVSGAHIEMDSDQVLRAVELYHSGQPLSLMVTPLTHIAAGLAEYKAAHGVNVDDAVTTANAEISKLFQLNVTQTRPFSINDRSATDADGQFYGFYLAAMSSWANWATQQNGVPPSAAFGAMELTQILFNDIKADGKLDGVGADSNGQPVPLAFAGQALGPSVYRTDFAQHMITMAAGAKNVTGVTVSDLLPRAQALVKDDDGLVPAAQNVGGSTLNSLAVEGAYYNGVMNFGVTPSENVVLKQVRFDVDGVVVGDAADPNQAIVQIITTQFGDGEHKVTATATDMLDNTFARTFKFKFDNTKPQTNITSAKITNLNKFILKGQYLENGAGLVKIMVGNQEAPFDSIAKTWELGVTLQPGQNTIGVTLVDGVGNQTITQTVVSLDQTPPAFDTSAGHGAARFSNRDSTFVDGVLGDTNIAPVFLDTTRVDLTGGANAGVGVNRNALTAAFIPYFAFKVNDPISNEVGSAANKIRVSLQIEKNGNVMVPWATLPVAPEYLLPLVTEKLYAGWLRSTPGDVIGLRLKAVDEAGNSSADKVFTFKPDFVVPAFAQGAVMASDKGNPLFLGTAFINRSSLYDVSFKDEEYSFTNAGRPIYISLADTGQHTAERWVEQRIREHEVIKTTTIEWRATFADLNSLTTDGCPQTPANPSTITSVYNYTGSGWQLEQPLSPPDSAPYPVNQDVPPAEGSWTPLLAFDGAFYSMPNGAQVDYSPVDPGPADPGQVAMINNWGGNCADLSSLEQREVYSYVSTLGPVNTLTPSFMKESKKFASGAFKVIHKGGNNGVDVEISPINGWYLIPSGAQIVVERWLVTPLLGIDDDTDVADPSGFNSYVLHSYDQEIHWSVQNQIRIDVVPDTGDAANIHAMTVRSNNLATASKVYKAYRPPQSQ